MPAALAEKARLVELRRKELWVEVDASAWDQESQFLQPKILAALDRAGYWARSKTCGCGWKGAGVAGLKWNKLSIIFIIETKKFRGGPMCRPVRADTWVRPYIVCRFSMGKQYYPDNY